MKELTNNESIKENLQFPVAISIYYSQRNSRGGNDPTDCFKIKVEDRFQCGATGKVKYTTRTEYCLPLPIPMTETTNRAEVAAYEAKKASGAKM